MQVLPVAASEVARVSASCEREAASEKRERKHALGRQSWPALPALLELLLALEVPPSEDGAVDGEDDELGRRLHDRVGERVAARLHLGEERRPVRTPRVELGVNAVQVLEAVPHRVARRRHRRRERDDAVQLEDGGAPHVGRVGGEGGEAASDAQRARRVGPREAPALQRPERVGADDGAP